MDYDDPRKKSVNQYYRKPPSYKQPRPRFGRTVFPPFNGPTGARVRPSQDAVLAWTEFIVWRVVLAINPERNEDRAFSVDDALREAINGPKRVAGEQSLMGLGNTYGNSADVQLGKMRRLIENKGHGVFSTRSGGRPSFHSEHPGEV